MTYPTWPHLENLDRILMFEPFYLSRPFVLTEKIHGFNARFGRAADGTPWIGTRNLVVAEGSAVDTADGQQGFAAFARQHLDRVPLGVTVFGEWAGKGIQKGIDYGTPEFYAFGVMGAKGRLFPWRDVSVAASALRLRTVPVVADEDTWTLDALREMRVGQSLIAEQGREGIVLTPAFAPPDGFTIAKFKAPEFAERAHARREAPPPADLENVHAFVDDYVTDMRLQHVLDQVREAEATDDPLARAYTGHVMRAMYQDVIREAGPDYEALSDEDKKVLGRVMNRKTLLLLEDARIAVVA